jgi:sterol desaturase/sphingolipid hydroxylase (fatty acid hydroxylase superfamily)
MLRHLVPPALALVIAAVVFAVVERRWPALRKSSAWRRPGSLLDVAYWFFNPLVSKPLTKVATIAAVVPIAVALGAPLRGDELQGWLDARRTIVSFQPAWLQAIEILLLADLIGYWTHRVFHGAVLWRFHAVHHASRELDWLAAARVHPVNEVLTRVAHVVPLFIFGFRGDLLAAAAPFLTFYAILLHANVPWSLGPLRYVLASPAFHRWHHTSEERGLDRNFAGLFPVWDLLFGTFYLPAGEHPTAFGVRDDVPEGLLPQLLWPFRRRTQPAAITPTPH